MKMLTLNSYYTYTNTSSNNLHSIVYDFIGVRLTRYFHPLAIVFVHPVDCNIFSYYLILWLLMMLVVLGAILRYSKYIKVEYCAIVHSKRPSYLYIFIFLLFYPLTTIVVLNKTICVFSRTEPHHKNLNETANIFRCMYSNKKRMFCNDYEHKKKWIYYYTSDFVVLHTSSHNPCKLECRSRDYLKPRLIKPKRRGL